MSTLMISLFLLTAITGFAQHDDDTVRYIQGLPVTGEDTLARTPVADQPPYDSVVTVPASQLPEQLRDYLSGDKLFRGWERRPFFYDEHTGLYWVHFADSATIRSYGFSKNGAPVSIQVKTMDR